MKKILFLLLLLLMTLANSTFAQVRTAPFYVPNDSAAFRTSLPENTIIIQTDNMLNWMLTSKASSTTTILTATKVPYFPLAQRTFGTYTFGMTNGILSSNTLTGGYVTNGAYTAIYGAGFTALDTTAGFSFTNNSTYEKSRSEINSIGIKSGFRRSDSTWNEMVVNKDSMIFKMGNNDWLIQDMNCQTRFKCNSLFEQKLLYPNVQTITGETYGLVIDGDTIKKQLVPIPDGANGSIQLNYDNALYASPQLSFDTTKMAFTAGYRIGTVGNNSLVLNGEYGYENTASGGSSIAIGAGVTASGYASTAIGEGSIASGYNSVAMGSNAKAWAGTSTAIGNTVEAKGASSVSMGRNTLTLGVNSIALGIGTIAHDFAEMSIGSNSTTSTGDSADFSLTNTAFKIGNGTSTPSDCFKVDFSGNTTIAGNAIVEDSVKTNHIEPLTATDTLEIGHGYIGVNGATAVDHLTIRTLQTSNKGLSFRSFSATGTDYPALSAYRSNSNTSGTFTRTVSGQTLFGIDIYPTNSSNVSVYGGGLNFVQPIANGANSPVDMVFYSSRTTSATANPRIRFTYGGQIYLLGSASNTATLQTSSAFSISFNQQTAQSIGVERSSSTNGSNLTIGAGGGQTGGTDRNAGMLILGGNAQITTGAGITSVRLLSLTRGASGTTDNTAVDRVIIPSEFNLIDAGNNDLFEVALPANSMTGGSFTATILCSDGTDFQSVTVKVFYDVVDKAGTITPQITEAIANTPAVSAGTLTRAWSVVDGANKITIRLVPTSSLIPTTMKITNLIFNGGYTALTQL